MAPDDLFTRDEVLGGLPARRAASTLFRIESRTAYLADQSGQSTDLLVSEEAARRRDLLFLEALGAGREPPVKPTIQDLERFAPDWAFLLPESPAIRATLARMLGRKYRFTRTAVPHIRATLGLDGAAVAQAYRRQYREDLAGIYATRIGRADQLRAAWGALSARVDALPPFSLAFLLTIAFGFSQAFLALPMGVAGVGAIPGVALVVAIGLVNVLTMACMAEVCARSGDFRYGKAFVGRLVTDFLGVEASRLFAAITALRTFLVLLAGSIGIGLTLGASTGIRAEVWMVVVAGAELYYLSRKSQRLTITTMLALLGVNLLLFLVITGLALGRLGSGNLLGAGLSLAPPAGYDARPLKLIFGVVLSLCIGHVYVIQCAKIVLPRDPSARSLIRGSVAGTAALVAMFVVWVLAVNGIVPPARLAREAGTALPSLAEQIGPVVHVLGTGLVVMLLGMSGLRTSTVVFNLVQERLPSRVRTTLTVPRRRADLLFEPRDASDRLRLGVRYLGLSQGVARLRVDVQRDGGFEHTEVLVDETWNADGLLAGVRTTPGGAATLTLDVLDAQPEAVRLRVTTAMRVSVQGDWDGAERPMGDLTELDAALREMLTWLIRRGEATLAVVARSRGEDEGAARATLDALVALGFAERVDDAVDPRYRIRLVRRGRPMSPEVWTALDPSAPPEPTARHGVAPSTRWLSVWRVLLSDAGQFVASSSPIVVVLLIGEALLLTGNASFAGVLGFTGVLANSMTAGIFPALLLLASRRKGDCVPGTVYRLLGAPAFVIGVSTLSAANLFVHGLVIYREMWSRACALILGAAIVAVTARMIRAGAFRRRSVVELREDLRAGGAVVLGVVSGGRPLATEITLGRPDGEEVRRADSVSVPTLSKLGYVIVRVPAGAAEELKVWAHRITPGGATEPLPALAEVRAGEDTRRFDLKLSGGQVVTRVGECEGWVRITLSGADDS